MPIESAQAAIAEVQKLLALPGGDGTALRVRRLDRPGMAYFVVHTVEHLACLDAQTGQLMASAPSQRSSVTLSRDDAIAAAGVGAGAQAELVWAPGRLTQSMFDPVWEVRAGDRTVYVDLRGRRFDTTEPKRPGG